MTLGKLDKHAPPAKRPKSAEWRPESVADVVLRLKDPHEGNYFDPREHLGPLVRALDEAVLKGRARKAVACPPQVGKTVCLTSALIFAALREPGLRHLYVAYTVDRVEGVRRDFEAFAIQLGLEPHSTGDVMHLAGGTTIQWSGAVTAITGFGFTGLVIIDDPVKGPEDVDSLKKRDKLHEWYLKVIGTRLHKRTSLILCNTRWHIDDLTGRLTKGADPELEYIRIPAQCDDPTSPHQQGRALGGWLCERLHSGADWGRIKKASSPTWNAMYQGLPLGDALCLFGEPTYYDMLPMQGGYRMGWGLDLAHTAHGDHSALVGGRQYGSGPDAELYVCDVVDKQINPDVYRGIAITHWERGGKGPVLWFYSGPEVLMAKEYRQQGMTTLQTRRAQEVGDKVLRARRAITAWNNGKILVPRCAPWVADFVAQVQSFTGAPGNQDDAVDALAAWAFDARVGTGAGGDWSATWRSLKQHGVAGYDHSRFGRRAKDREWRRQE